jgi:hypothetical protein
VRLVVCSRLSVDVQSVSVVDSRAVCLCVIDRRVIGLCAVGCVWSIGVFGWWSVVCRRLVCSRLCGVSWSEVVCLQWVGVYAVGVQSAGVQSAGVCSRLRAVDWCAVVLRVWHASSWCGIV